MTYLQLKGIALHHTFEVPKNMFPQHGKGCESANKMAYLQLHKIVVPFA